MNMNMRLWMIIALLALCSGARAQTSRPTTAPAEQPLKPTLKFPTQQSYEAEIKEPAVLLKSDHLWLFAPQRKTTEAKAIFKRLTSAYDELYRIVGVHTKYKIIVYHSPTGWGGTSECVIDYDYSNLDFDKSDEWRRYKIPHVSGYIEEMAHNFVSTTHSQFGWEMVGWNLGVKVTQRVAPNPIFARSVQATRDEQAQTFARYKANNFVFPADLQPNLCDRIHSHLLYQCEQRDGPNFYADFFTQIRNHQQQLADAEKGKDERNARYRITVDCFDQLPKLSFKKLLQQNHISTTVDVKSLHPTEPGWNRRFEP
jgi:hypothetical protein